MFRLAFTDRLKFLLERLFVRGAHYQLLAVAGLIGIISVIGGMLVLPAGEPTSSVQEAVWWAFLRLTDPGYLGDDVGAWRRVVATALTVMGYVLFMGSLVAILTQWLNGKMRQLEQGLTPVAARHHIALLGWTNRTLPVMRELTLSSGRLRRFLKLHGARRLRVVILDENITALRSQALRDDPVIRPYSRDIILRSGSRLNADHLHRAAAFHASAVLVPTRAFAHQNQVGADVETVKTLMSLDARGRELGAKLPYVVAEIQDSRRMNMARGAYSGPLEVIAGDAALSRLMAQNLRHPGLSSVYNELLSHGDGNEFYIVEARHLAGHRVGSLHHCFPGGLICGLVRPEGEGFRPRLNPPGDELLAEHDRLVILAPSFDAAQPDHRRHPRAEKAVAAPARARERKAPAERHVLLLGWNHTVPALLQELASYPDERFRLDILSTLNADIRRRILAQYASPADNVHLSQIEGDFLDEAMLREARPERYSHVLLASSDRLPSGEEADARTVVGHLLLQQVLAESTAPRPRVLLELSDPGNASLLGGGDSEILISPMLLSHMLAQVALRRELRAVFDQLFTAGGPEILFRPATHYLEESAAVTFQQARRAAATLGDTALGFCRTTDKGRPACSLNPARDRTLDPAAGDLLVVISGH